MAGPNDMASWMQSLMQGQGAGSVNLGPSILAWLQSLQGQGSGQNTGPGPGNVGPVNGFIPDPTQTPPNVGPGPGGSRPGGGVYAPTVPWRVPPANEGAQVVAPQPAGPMPWRVPPANEGPRVVAPNWLTSTGAGMSAPSGATPPPFNWLTSTGAGMSAPPGSPPVAYGGPTAAADASHAPKGPLASASGGIGSDAKFPLKRRAGAPDLGYYVPTTGNARAATYVPFTDPNDPRIYRG